MPQEDLTHFYKSLQQDKDWREARWDERKSGVELYSEQPPRSSSRIHKVQQRGWNLPRHEHEDYWKPERAKFKEEKRVQPYDKFHTKCRINDKVCSMIIDGERCAHMISTYVVEKLNLQTFEHYKPYKFRWGNGYEEIEVTKQVFVPFSIGKYKDEVMCDVVPMHVIPMHVLLGWPWQRARKVSFEARTNRYSLVHNKKSLLLYH